MLQIPKISVLACVHSKSIEYDSLLERALQSLVIQTYKDFEVVVVLDQCHENTQGLVESFSDELNLSVHIKPVKSGLASAKNFGLLRCQGDLIAFLDADDQYMPFKLAIQKKFMDENPQIDFLGTLAYDLHPAGDVTPSCFLVGQFETHNELVWALGKENVLNHGSMLIKAEVLAALGGYSTDKRYLGKEDWELWVRAINNGYRFHQLQERAYIYSLGTGISR